MTDYRKLVIVDLDDTLWEGTVGDAGWLGIRPFAQFQRALKDLQERGVLLAIASRNTEAVAVDALSQQLPGQVLQLADFAARRISWGDKAEMVAGIVAELNLGLQSVVFIDDNPVMRARVREAHPDVLVPDWPSPPDDVAYATALQALDCFDASAPTAEDLMRTDMYARERARAKSRAQSGSLEDWLRTLGTQLTIEPLSPSSLARTAQLLNKTNQMNLRTRRLSADDYAAWASSPGCSVDTVRVADRFGDAGLTGILGLQTMGVDLHIVDFVLSCRVMGRLVEEAMVAHVVGAAKTQCMQRIVAEYLPTARNIPCLEFWQQRSGFTQIGNTFFRLITT